jgi:hypothetical protein
VNSKLIRRLRREAKANPAKAAALAIVVLVAIWFWAPLVVHWCSPAAAPAEEIAAAGPAVQPSVDGASRIAPADAPIAPAVPWQQLVRAIEQDPRMRPSRRLGEWRNPFGPSAAALAAELAAAKGSQQKKIKRAPPPELLPADAGLVLNSTLVGNGRRMALIGGEPYWEGDAVPAAHGDGNFKLVEISPRQVVLERQGKHYDLEIKTTGHNGPWAGEPVKPRSDSSLPNTMPRNSASNNGKAATGRQAAPFAKFNTNE